MTMKERKKKRKKKKKKKKINQVVSSLSVIFILWEILGHGREARGWRGGHGPLDFLRVLVIEFAGVNKGLSFREGSEAGKASGLDVLCSHGFPIQELAQPLGSVPQVDSFTTANLFFYFIFIFFWKYG